MIDQLLRHLRAQAHGGHRTGAARRALQAAALVDDVNGGFQRERPGRPGGSNFSDAVAQPGGRAQTLSAEQARNADL